MANFEITNLHFAVVFTNSNCSSRRNIALLTSYIHGKRVFYANYVPLLARKFRAKCELLLRESHCMYI